VKVSADADAQRLAAGLEHAKPEVNVVRDGGGDAIAGPDGTRQHGQPGADVMPSAPGRDDRATRKSGLGRVRVVAGGCHDHPVVSAASGVNCRPG
jgi:hypothetical protein